MNAPSLLAAGQVVGGDFTIVKPLEEGGMGAVFLAQQGSTGKLRALKVMHREIVANPEHQQRFVQEARIGSRIASDHVVEVVAAGVDAPTGLPYLVMELLEGEDLRHRIDGRGAMSVAEARVVFDQLGHAMAAAHAGGVVHRDLKPENVFLARSRRAGSDPFEVKVLDFGIAKLVAEAGTRSTKSSVGSPMWMAPEQTQPGPVTPAADVWALGLIAYEVLTGRSFWRTANDAGGTTAQLLREVVLDPIPRASDRAREQGVAERLPAGFDAWFARCIDREPAARFQEAGALVAAFRTALDGRDALADTTAVTSPGGRTTGDASSYLAPSTSPPRAVSAPPFRAPSSDVPLPRPPGLPPETPLASVKGAAAPSPPPPSRSPLVFAAIIGVALAGVAVGYSLRSPQAVVQAPPAASLAANVPASASAAAPASASGPASASASASASGPASASASASASAPAPAPAPAPPRPSAISPAVAPSSAPRPALAGGFSDPVDRGGAVLWKVQGRQVRLFTRLVSNESNVTDAVVRKAIEWSSWEYLRCYERAFGASKDMPEGVVIVDFEILDQLPRHAKLRSSTIASDVFNSCVVSTLLGQTINAAGPEGKGHAAEAFRFVPN